MNTKRHKQLMFRVTEKELEQIKKKSKKANLNQQEYLLKCALNKKITNTDTLKEVMIELKRQGNNLNQIAKKCNENDYVYAEEINQLGKELNEVWQLLKQYLVELV